MAAQIAFCLLLLVLAALFTRSMQSLLRIDVGYDRDQILVARMDVRSMGYRAGGAPGALYGRILERVSSLPGVTSASISLNGPLGTSQRTSSLGVEGYTPGPDERLTTNEEIVTDKYFETVGLRIVEGRGFQPEDRASGSAPNDHQPVDGEAILSEWRRGRQTVELRAGPDAGCARDRRRRRRREVLERARRVAEHDLSA